MKSVHCLHIGLLSVFLVLIRHSLLGNCSNSDRRLIKMKNVKCDLHVSYHNYGGPNKKLPGLSGVLCHLPQDTLLRERIEKYCSWTLLT
jgi:hypothetical protein